jgi:uncharacterized protein involved in outer membrane biogenesis
LKRILIGVGVGLGALLLAAWAIPAMMDWSKYQGIIVDRIESATGRAAVIEGDVTFALLPHPAFFADKLRIANPDGARAADFLTAEDVGIDVALFPLFSGKMRVTRVVLDDPVLNLEVLDDGRKSWVFDGPDSAKGKDRKHRIKIQDFRARNATITYRDGDAPLRAVRGLDLDLSAGSLSGPFRLSGKTEIHDTRLGFSLGLGDIKSAPVPFDLRLDSKGGTEFRYAGTASLEGGDPFVRGELRAVSDDASVLARLSGTGAPAELKDRKLVLTALTTLAGNRLSTENLAITLGEMSARGDLELALAPDPVVRARLQAGVIDLDVLLDGMAPAGEREQPAGNGSEDGGPSRLTADLDLMAETVIYRGEAVRDVRLRAAMQGDRLSVPSLTATLPGSTSLKFTGSAPTDGAPPGLAGKLSLRAGQPRAFLGWLGADPSEVPEGRLSKLSLEASVSGDARMVKLDDIRLAVDETLVDGWLDLPMQDDAPVRVDLRADRLNADSYKPAEHEPSAEFDWSTLAFLNEWDMDASLAIDRLTAEGFRLDGALAELTLRDGVLSVRRAGAENEAGGSILVSGTVKDFGRRPLWDLRGRVMGERLSDLVSPAESSGDRFPLFDSAVDLAVETKGNSNTASFQAQGTLGPTAVSLAGDSKSWGSEGRELALRFDLTGKSWDAVAARAGFEDRRPLEGYDGPFVLKGKVLAKGDKYTTDLTADLGGGKILVSGPVTLGDETSNVDIGLTAQGTDVNRFLRTVGVPFNPAPDRKGVGGFMIKATLKGPTDKLSVDDLKVELGPAKLSGRLVYDTTGPRPRLDATLEAGSIDADQYLPRRETGPEIVREPGGERWSREPFDLEMLRGFDGSLTIRAERFVYRRYAFENPALDATLKDGRMTLRALAATLFGGRLDAAGVVDARAVPRLSLKLALNEASVEQALTTVADLDFATGSFDFTAEVAGAGANEHDLVSGLDGTATLSARGGVVRGFDMPRLSRELQELQRYGDFFDLADAALSGGETRYTTAGGTVRIQRGVARTEDLRATLDQAEGKAVATVDLPDWTVDADLTLRLTAPEHAGTPAVGMTLTGPIDSPEQDNHLGKLGKFVAKRLADTVIRDVFGDDSKTGNVIRDLLGTEQQGQPSPEPEDPEERRGKAKRVLNKLLDKLDKSGGE